MSSSGGGSAKAGGGAAVAAPLDVAAARAAAKAVGTERDALVSKLQISQDILATVSYLNRLKGDPRVCVCAYVRVCVCTCDFVLCTFL